uniref:Extracellular calcium-sensing receptor-like n=1 Tax=Mastacembelus armatus TaxID=205130 RepID=A0A3Q3M5W6_9TELE
MSDSVHVMLLLLLLFMGTYGTEEDTAQCKMLGSPEFPLLSKKGDFTIGGTFSIHSQISKPPLSFTDTPEPLICSRINFREFRFAQTMIFAIEEINNSSSLLPNISIGYKVFDTCGSTLPSTRAVMGAMNGHERTVGKTCSALDTAPGISHFATCACLSNRKDYPSFFRTIPSDYYQSRALAKLVKHFGWTWVGAIRSDNDYGNDGMATFIRAANQEGVCVEYSEAISRTDSSEEVARVVRLIRSSSARVLVAFLAQSELDILLEEALNQNLTGLQWVGSESWITAGHLANRRYSGILSGSLGFTIRKAKISGLRDFLLQVNPSQDPQNNLLREFWEAAFECKFQSSALGQTQCTGSERLQDINNTFTDVSQLRISNCVYKAVYAVAHAIHNILKCGQSGDRMNQTCIWEENFEAKQVKGHFHELLFYISHSDSAECSRCPLEYWSNDDRSQCVPKVIEFLSFGETMGVLLTIFSLFGAGLTLVVSCVFFRFRHTPLVKASNSELSFLLLFSLSLCFLCSLTFMGQPTNWSCMLRHTTFGIAFALCMSCILAKTIAVVIAFKAKRPANTVPQCSAPLQRTSVLSCTLMQVLVCSLWLTLAPPYPNKNTAHATERIILECDLGSPVGFWAVLGYIGLLAGLCFMLAFLARKLPDNFNEAKFITFSMLIFCAVWITFIPAYVSSPGKFTVAVEIFAILSSSFGLLFCIFIPKCYILLLKPERNTKKHMMGRN